MILLFTITTFAVLVFILSVIFMGVFKNIFKDNSSDCEFADEGCDGKARPTLLRIGSGKGMSEYEICEACEIKFNRELDEELIKNKQGRERFRF